MLRICALANRIHGRHQEMYLALERSLLRKKIPLFTFVEGVKWSWKRKVEWEGEMASAYPDDYFVFIDAFDYLFVGEKEELEEVVRESPLRFSCDCGPTPWPYHHLGPAYEIRREAKTPWRWVNGCGPMGRGKEIAEAVRYGIHDIGFASHDTDQTFWTVVYLNGYGELDQDCRMTQVLYDSTQPPDFITPHLGHKDGRVVNLLTGSRPQFIHATGHSWRAIPPELLPEQKDFSPNEW